VRRGSTWCDAYKNITYLVLDNIVRRNHDYSVRALILDINNEVYYRWQVGEIIVLSSGDFRDMTYMEG
jgi:hypothetical protein